MSPRRILVLATRNRGKVAEMSRLFTDLPLDELRCALDFPELEEVVEDGSSLEENAFLKARSTAQATGLMCIADDTGLFVDALDGAPGIHAARYAGEGCTYEDNCRKLLRELEGVAPPRTARFETAMVFVDPAGVEHVVKGVLQGEILTARRGTGGFGYDPLFQVEGESRTLAEMALEEKNRISHRAQAAAAMHEYLKEYLAEYHQGYPGGLA